MSKLGDKIKSLPVIGPIARFPSKIGNGIDWLKNKAENIPLVGPYVIKPYFSAMKSYSNYVMKYPKFAVTHVMAPFAVAGAVSAGLQYAPDLTSEDIESFMNREGIDIAALDNVDHENIRVYRDNTTFLNAFHMAGQMADKTGDRIAEVTDSGFIVDAVVTAASYPPMLVTAFMYANVEKNAFTLALTNDEDTCHIINNAYSADPREMIAALSGLPSSAIALNNDDLSWLPSGILLHEAKHCDNGKDTFRNLAEILRDTNVEKADADSQRVEIALGNIQEVIDQIVLIGEEDSDVHTLDFLQAEYPESVNILKYARSIQPFTGNMDMSSNHATGHRIDRHFSEEDKATTFQTWEALEMAKMLVNNAREMNYDSSAETRTNQTRMNYHAAKEFVIPFLQAKQGQTFPRGDENIDFSLVLEHVELFVEAMESRLINAQFINPAAITPSENHGIPDFQHNESGVDAMGPEF